MKITKNETGTTEVFEKEGLSIRPMSEVQIKRIEYLAPNLLPCGKLVLLGGQPATGKTTTLMYWIAALTTGRPFPFASEGGDPKSVLFVSAEDDPEDTLKPRLAAAGADMSRVFIWDATPKENGKKLHSFLLSRDLEAFEQTLIQNPDIALVGFDPLSAFIGAKDSHRDADVREVLGPLNQLAAKYGVCVVGITHLNKNEGASAMARFMGSTGFVAAARAAYMTAHYEDGMILAPAKTNLHEQGLAMKYDIESVVLDIYSPAINTSRIQWLSQVDVTADEVLTATRSRDSAPKENEAEDFLYQVLRDGPRTVKELQRSAGVAGIKWRTIERAKESLKITSHKSDFGGGWKWYTPEQYELRKAAKNKQVGGLREQEKTSDSQPPIFGGLGREKPLKAKQDKGFTEGRQASEIHPDFDANLPSDLPESTKAAKCGVLGNNEGKRLL